MKEDPINWYLNKYIERIEAVLHLPIPQLAPPIRRSNWPHTNSR